MKLYNKKKQERILFLAIKATYTFFFPRHLNKTPLYFYLYTNILNYRMLYTSFGVVFITYYFLQEFTAWGGVSAYWILVG